MVTNLRSALNTNVTPNSLKAFIIQVLGKFSAFSAYHFPLVAEAESTDVLRLSRLVGSSGGGGVDVEERRGRSVARLSVVKPLAQEQDVPQVADVAARQS